ncbi:MAG: tail fiber domain-containing protein [Paracoccaceae bacterium]
MKRSILALTLSLAMVTSTAIAGGLEVPVMEQTVIEAETASSAGNILVPLILLLLVAAALSLDQTVALAPSDERLKSNIDQIGMSPSGLPIYQFSYIGSTKTYQGAMAQDVLAHTPGAVFVGPFGYMAVDYDKIDVEMKIIN